MAIDLHLHSTASDGTMTPEELVEMALNLKLKAIAITDHDSVDGIIPALIYGQRKKIEVISAVELSSDLNGRDIHFLGYYIDHRAQWFLDHLKKLRQHRFDRAVKMVELLSQKGIDVPLQQLMEKAGNSAVGRAHVARVMLDQGYIDNIEEAFEKYLGRKAPCYVEKYNYAPEEIIQLIKQVGGLPVLAHPALSQVDELIPDFINAGLVGLEIYHSDHTPEDVSFYRQWARRAGLIVTGGSDCHGIDSSRGMVIGSIKVPDSILRDLKKAANL